MTDAPKIIPVEIWTDIVCPFCWIGLARFRAALTTFPHADHVQVTHRAFRLMPDAAPAPANVVLQRKTGGSPEKVATMMQQLEQSAAELGLTYRLTGTQLGDTIDAHRLLKLAAHRGQSEAATERLFRAFYTDNVSIFDHASLAALAIDVGLDAAEVDEVLASEVYRDEVEADARRLSEVGGRGTPFFLVDGVAVASDTLALAAALDHAWATWLPVEAESA